MEEALCSRVCCDFDSFLVLVVAVEVNDDDILLSSAFLEDLEIRQG